jgi:hypothetical protein
VFFDVFIAIFGAVDLAAQIAGVVLVINGVNSPARWLERDREPRLVFVPSAPGTPLGASLVGRF